MSHQMSQENQEEEARRRIDELTDFGAQAIHRGNLVRKAASLSENVSQSSTDEPATNEAIAAFDQYVAQAKKSLDQRRAETIELLKQPAGELVVSATNFHLETIKRKESTIEEQASTIKQQASIIDRLRQPSTFLWNISGQDFSAIQYNDFVESPQFGLLLDSGFCERGAWYQQRWVGIGLLEARQEMPRIGDSHHGLRYEENPSGDCHRGVRYEDN